MNPAEQQARAAADAHAATAATPDQRSAGARSRERQIKAMHCRQHGHQLDDHRRCQVCDVVLPAGFTAEELADLQRRVEQRRQRARERAEAGELNPPADPPDTYGHTVVAPEISHLPPWHDRRTFDDLRAQWGAGMSDHQAAAITFTQERVDAYASMRRAKGLLFTGPVGAGKTSIAAAGAVRLGEPRGCKWRKADEFFAALKAEWDNHTAARVMNIAVTTRVFFLDGLFPTARPVNAWEVARLQEIIERRYDRPGALILTTNLPAQTQHKAGVEIPGLIDLLGESVWSRVTSSMDVVPIVGADHRVQGKAA